MIEAAGRNGSDSNADRLAQRRHGNARGDVGRLSGETRHTDAAGANVKRSRTPVLRVERSMGVAVFRCVREMTLRREVDRVFDKLTHPGDETPQEENGES